MLWKLSIEPISAGSSASSSAGAGDDFVEYFFKVDEHHGKLSQTIGKHINSKYMLTFSEGYYLLNNGRAVLDERDDFHQTILKYLQKNYNEKYIYDFIRKTKTISKLIYNGFIIQDDLIFAPDSLHSKKNPKIPPIGSLKYLFDLDSHVLIEEDKSIIYSFEDVESNPIFLKIEPISNFINTFESP